MNPVQRDCWQRIVNHSLDATGAELTFSHRLARDNDWPPSFAKRVIEEYRRFCYLAVHAGHPVTPSDEVDQVWHQHLLYSHDYWELFCPKVLGQALHHGPTAGGSTENTRYRDWYQQTLDSYQRVFGDPPIDVWPEPDRRFANAAQFVRINRAERFDIDRCDLRRWLARCAGCLGVMALSTSLAASDPTIDYALWWTIVAITGLIGVVLLIGLAFSRSHQQSGSKRKADAAASGGGAVGAADAVDSGDGGGSSGCSGGCGGGCGGCGG